MNKLFTSTLLTLAAVPFLIAAPNAVKKVQNQAPTSTAAQTTTAKTKAKKHVKKSKTTATATATPSTPAQK